MFSYDQSTKGALRNEYRVSVTEAVSRLLDGTNIKDELDARLKETRLNSLRLRGTIDLSTLPETDVSEKEYATALKEYSTELRSSLWQYRRLSLRIALLGTILNDEVNKKKFNFRLTKVLEGLLDSDLKNAKNSVTLGEAVHKISSIVGVHQITTKSGQKIDSNAWINDEIALMFISELAELGYLDLLKAGKTHIVQFSDDSSKKLGTQEELLELSKIAKFLNLQTILLNKPEVELQRTSQSSWWYKTPSMSSDQLEFVEAMHSIRYEFVDNAEELIEDAYRQHLQVDKLEPWALARVEELKSQIQASKEQGYHYIATQDDSVGRTYYKAEIGHFQTSSSLRSLVKPYGMTNPVKWDFRNNVVQMYALMLKRKDLGQYVGLVAREAELEDLRSTLAYEMNKRLGVDTFNKTNTKPLFMIWAYNAGKTRLMEGTFKEEVDYVTGDKTQIESTPGLVAIAGIDDTERVWSTWDALLTELVPSIVHLKTVFKKLLKDNPVLETSWTLPDGAIAQYASVETEAEELEWVDSFGRRHQHTHHRKELSRGAKNTGLLPRLIHSYDAWVMRQLVIRAKRLGITVIPNHDSFIFDEEHEETIFSLVDDIFTELLESNELSRQIKHFNVKGANLTITNEEGEALDATMFGDKLTAEDVICGMPMSPEDM